MTGFNWEDSCTCEDPFASNPPAFIEACPAHGGEVRDVSLRLGGWHTELVADAAAPAVLTNTHLRLHNALHALTHLLGEHWRHEAPGPTPSPTGTCGSCGGTGEIFHGFAIEGGPIFDGPCGCDTPFCGGCGEAWPCGHVRTIGEAVGVAEQDEDGTR